MLSEAFPRLAIRLRSTFPDAEVTVVEGASRVIVRFPALPSWEVTIVGRQFDQKFQVVESNIRMTYDCFQKIAKGDVNRFVAAENLGLRGATLILEEFEGKRVLKVRSGFIAQKGRTRDEAENVVIDTVSLVRFARMFDDRIRRSIARDKFCYEMYYSQYLAASIGRIRFVNYARGIFQGCTTSFFQHVTELLNNELNLPVSHGDGATARIRVPESKLDVVLRVPEEIPMLTCSASLLKLPWDRERIFALVGDLNAKIKTGHFEVNSTGREISYVTWKQLANDLRYYTLDHLVGAFREAEDFLREAIQDLSALTSESSERGSAVAMAEGASEATADDQDDLDAYHLAA